MAEIPGLNELSSQRPSYVDQMSELTKGQGLNEKIAETVNTLGALLGSKSLSVNTTSSLSGTGEVGTQTGATGVPALDNPADPEAVKADLEKLIAYLKLENDQKQAEMAKSRIETQKTEIDQRHTEQTEKLQKSIEEMDKAA